MALATQSYFSNLLVAADGSSYSLQAEETAANLAKAFNSKVTVLHVTPHDIKHQPYPYTGFPDSISDSVRHEMEGWFEQRGRQIAQQAKALFAQEGVKAEVILEEFADPSETILEVAKEKNCDTLILGNKGSSEIPGFALGGVTENVLRHADCAVLIVKNRPDFSKILVAHDGSKHAQRALNYAVQLGEKCKSRITLLNVAQTMLPRMQEETAKSMGERVVSEAESHVKGASMDKKVELGHPAKTIIDFAKKGNFDLIVLGSRGLNPVKRFVLGSVSDKVARHAHCSVLTVR
jgi:nucleotide-binding universal stress UspA family protein